MFVRKRPGQSIRTLVTKGEADEIDQLWSIVAGTIHASMVNKELFIKRKHSLKQTPGGNDPSDNDVIWSLFNEQLIEYAKNGDWGNYRGIRFGMGELLRSELKFQEALKTYLEVCYLDMNGPRNIGGETDPKILEEFPPFEPDYEESLAPRLTELINLISHYLSLSKDEIKKVFIEHNQRVFVAIKLPLSPEQCWGRIERELT